jgi:histidine triad (HIT) family protein
MCIFCRIAAHELPASIIYENKRTMAFLEIQPITPGHIIVIPKTHAESFCELVAEDVEDLMRVGQLMDRALHASAMDCEGVDLIITDGRAAGQDIGHVHMHVFPRFEGDEFEWNINSTSRKPTGREELDENTRLIKQALKKIGY